MVVAPVGEEKRGVIELRRRDGGGVLRIGHRGAAHIAPENTIDSLRAAVEHGVDLVEFDVLDLHRGPLVLAHSDHLDEVSHGRATGSVRERTLAELREVAPDLPTLDAQGIAGFEVNLWYGLLTPTGTPREVILRYNAVVNDILQQPKTVEALAKQGLTVAGGTPEQFGEFIASDLARWQNVVKGAGITAQ